jgi:hypothetical protein
MKLCNFQYNNTILLSYRTPEYNSTGELSDQMLYEAVLNSHAKRADPPTCENASLIKRELLRYLLLYEAANRRALCNIKAQEDNLIEDYLVLFPCWLHCALRVGQGLLTRGTVENIQNRSDLSPAEKDRLIEKLEAALVKIFRGIRMVSHRTVRIKRAKGGDIETMAFNADKLRKIFLHFRQVLDAIYDTPELRLQHRETYDNWLNIASAWSDILTVAQRKRDEWSTTDANVFQDKLDVFGRMYVNLLNETSESTYIHYIIEGHFRQFILHHGKLITLSNEALESLHNLVKRYYYTRTNKEGNTGKGGSKLTLDCLVEFAVRRWAYYLDGGVTLEFGDYEEGHGFIREAMGEDLYI